MGFTVKQTAELLGVGDATVYRLLKRGLLRSSSALRTKVIPKLEIDRFLKETTRSP
jgi:excisionase family DNA binding protein